MTTDTMTPEDRITDRARMRLEYAERALNNTALISHPHAYAGALRHLAACRAAYEACLRGEFDPLTLAIERMNWHAAPTLVELLGHVRDIRVARAAADAAQLEDFFRVEQILLSTIAARRRAK